MIDGRRRHARIKNQESKLISDEKKEAVGNLYESGISEEFVAMQRDLEIPVVINIRKEIIVYKGS